MVCSGTSVKWLAWPHWGISLPAQSHPKCCSVAGGLAFRVLYSIGGCCSGSCEFWQKINRAFGKKKKLEEVWVLFDNYACCFQVKIIKRKAVNEWLTQFRVYLKFIAENLLMTPGECSSLCSSAVPQPSTRGGGIQCFLLCSHILGFLHSPCGKKHHFQMKDALLFHVNEMNVTASWRHR